MVTQPISQPPLKLTPPTLFEKALASFIGALSITLLAGFLFSFIFGIAHLGRIYPGVAVGGIDLSGMRRTEAVEYLSRQLTFPLTGQVTLFYKDHSWTFTPSELG